MTSRAVDFFARRAASCDGYDAVNFDRSGTFDSEAANRAERDAIMRYVPFDGRSRVLDIGCGVGRWADNVADVISDGLYVGVDPCEEMLSRARAASRANAMFVRGSLADIRDVLARHGLPAPYDVVLINGVLEYVGDAEVTDGLAAAFSLLRAGGFLYVKEPVATEARIDFDEDVERLGGRYRATYRTVTEYEAAFSESFPRHSCGVVACGPSWGMPYDCGSETYNAFWVMRRFN